MNLCKGCSEPITAFFASYPSRCKACVTASVRARKQRLRDLRGPIVRPSTADRLWRRVDKSGDCWLWTGATFKATGYGQINVEGKPSTTHRLAYTVAVGSIPDGLYVCHHCDVRLCCKPAHLFLGTAQDNMTDMVQKGRYKPRVLPKGSAVKTSKLTEPQVGEIRHDLTAGRRNGPELARRFGVSTSTIYAIKSGQNWRHVPC